MTGLGLQDDETIAEWHARITPHYPTSAELAAFRHSMWTPAQWAYVAGTGMFDPTRPLWTYETMQGVGIPAGNGPYGSRAPKARREAARMRSEAFVFLSANVPDLLPVDRGPTIVWNMSDGPEGGIFVEYTKDENGVYQGGPDEGLSPHKCGTCGRTCVE